MIAITLTLIAILLNMVLTNIIEIDQYILLYLDDQDYRSVKSTCHYIRYLLSDDNFWREKTKLYHNELLSNKCDDKITWRQWYFFWSKYKYGLKLVFDLNLSPSHVYLSLLCFQDKKVRPGLEVFRNINFTLEKAFLSDDDTLRYMVDKYNKIVSFLFESDLIKYTSSVADYDIFIDRCLQLNKEELVRKLINDAFSFAGHFIEDCPNFLQIFGKYKRRDLAEEFYGRLDDEYLLGLVEGHHDKEVVDLLNTLDMKFSDITPLISTAIKAENYDFINMYDAKSIINSCQVEREDLSLIDLSLNGIKYTINTKTDPWSMLLSLVKQYSKERFNIIANALIHGRYDFILRIDFQELQLRDNEWHKMIFASLFTEYKDLILYLLIQSVKCAPLIFHDLKLIPINEGCCETLILYNDFINLPYNKITKTDYYSLLLKPYLL